jgi:hypothetical protein
LANIIDDEMARAWQRKQVGLVNKRRGLGLAGDQHIDAAATPGRWRKSVACEHICATLAAYQTPATSTGTPARNCCM